jgi:Lysine efflux permease
MLSVYFTGFALGLSLIVAIGAQNAFVLRQGLRREHIFWVCLICALSDAALIIFGVSGFQVISARFEWINPLLRYGGAAFLFVYGLRCFYSAITSKEGLSAASSRPTSLKRTLAVCLMLTWLNPHVYLDTVVMLGMLSAAYPGREQFFALGAMTASFLFFFTLGYGARLLRPLFENPKTWRIFESLIGILMLFLAFKLLRS